MSSLSILQDVYSNIDYDTWCKGAMMDEDGRMCLVGHLGAAYYGVLRDENGKPVGFDAAAVCSHSEYMGAFRTLESVVRVETNRSIMSFNDSDSTSLEDVKLMVKKAIGRLEESEAN